METTTRRPNTDTRARIETQRVEDLTRLARQAERAGVRILVDRRRGQHVATSATDPAVCYLVVAEAGCSCLGYTYAGKCQHHSLLLAELGLIPETAAERAAALARDAFDEADAAYEAAMEGVIASGRGWPAVPDDTRRRIAA